MREAFSKAVQGYPASPLAEIVQTSSARAMWNSKELERGKMLSSLGEKMFTLGEQWYGLRVSRVGFGGMHSNAGLGELRRIWERLRSDVVLQSRGDRIILLEKLSDGMWFSEEHLSVAHKLIAQATMTETQELTSASKLFINGIADLSSYIPQRKSELLEFISKTVKKDGDLKGVIVGVADWILIRDSWQIGGIGNK